MHVPLNIANIASAKRTGARTTVGINKSSVTDYQASDIVHAQGTIHEHYVSGRRHVILFCDLHCFT